MYHWQLSENDDAGSTYVYHDPYRKQGFETTLLPQ